MAAGNDSKYYEKKSPKNSILSKNFYARFDKY